MRPTLIRHKNDNKIYFNVVQHNFPCVWTLDNRFYNLFIIILGLNLYTISFLTTDLISILFFSCSCIGTQLIPIQRIIFLVHMRSHLQETP
jgi:hypothetical protein